MMFGKGVSSERRREQSMSAGCVLVFAIALLQAISTTHARPIDPSRPRGRVLQQQQQEILVMGSCSFINTWTGETCMEFHGQGWTSDSMKERCGEESDSTLSEGADGACPRTSEFAGMCSKAADGIEGAIEATAMMTTPTSDCAFNSMACRTFLSGAFDPSPACADESVGPPPSASMDSGGTGASWDGSGFGSGGGPPQATETNTMCDTSPNALTDALAKMLNATAPTTTNDEKQYSRVVDHTCIDSTGYAGKRCFYTYIPECATVDSPLVYDIHGVSLCPLWNFETTGWIQKSIDNCFVVVWPVGNLDPEMSAFSCFALEGGYDVTEAAEQHESGDDGGDEAVPGIEYETEDCCCFNFGGPRLEPPVFDDLTFLRNVAAVVVDDVPERTDGAVTIDAKRIYMGGHSNGCTAGLSMAAAHSDMVAAVCCHAPALISPFPSDYEAVPIWLVHGKMDGTVPYNGAFPDGVEAPKYNPGAEQMNALIGVANGCTAMSSSAGEDRTPTGNGTYTYYNQENCGGDSAVKLMSLDAAGHTPFLGGDLFMGDYDGAVIASVDTTQHAWDFCSGYAKTVEPVLELVTPATASDINASTDSNTDSNTASIGSQEEEDESDDTSATQDAIDSWKERNSAYATSSSFSITPVQHGPTVISFLLAVSLVTVLSELFM